MADFQKEGFGNNPRDATSDRIGPKLSEKKGDTKSKASGRKESPIQSESFFDDTRSHREFQGREREKTGGRSKGKHKDPVESDFEKIVEKRDKAQKKFDKAKSATQKTTYSMQRVFDENTGSYSYKVVADKKDIKLNKKKLSKKLARKLTYETVAIARAKAMEGADDNDAVDAVNFVEQSGERLFNFTKSHTKSSAQRKYDRLSKSQKKLKKLNKKYDKKKFEYDTTKEFENWLDQNPHLKDKTASNELQKQFQKNRIKRQYIKAAKKAQDAEKATEFVLENAKTTTVIARKIQEFVARNAKILIVVGIFAILLVMIMSMFSSCAAMFGEGISTTIAGTYLSEPADIDEAALKMTELETDLREIIKNIEEDWPNYDEYQYIGEIGLGIDPIMLISYLSAKYTVFTYADVESEIEDIFKEIYTLTLTPVTDSTYSILKVEVEIKPFEEFVNNNLTDEQKAIYSAYMVTKGDLQVFAPPVDYDWFEYISSYYGYRLSPMDGERQLHRGLDIAVPDGSTVFATHDGTVQETGYDPDFGNYIVLTNDEGYTSKFGHLSQVSVSTGQSVNKGSEIGKTGNTGSSTGSHLHLECLYNGEYYNPIFYFNTKGSSGSSTLSSYRQSSYSSFYTPNEYGDDAVQALFEEANKYVGTPFTWGGSTPETGFDCSGFVCWSLRESGVYPVSRITAQGLYDLCEEVKPGEEQPGDLIFFTGTYTSQNPVTHVGIVSESGVMLHAGDPIKYSPYTTNYWQNHFYAFGRLIN